MRAIPPGLLGGVPPLTSLIAATGGKCTGLWLPAGIKAVDTTHWAENVGTAGAIFVLNTAVIPLTTVAGQQALQFNGAAQAGQTTCTLASLVGNHTYDHYVVGALQGNSTTFGSAGNYWQNWGITGSSDTNVNMLSAWYNGTTLNYPVSEIFGSPADCPVAASITTAGAFTIGSPFLLRSWVTDVDDTLRMRLNNNAPVASAGGAASWPLTGFFQVGRSGSHPLQVDVSLVMTCISSLTPSEDAAVRTILSANYQSQPWT